MFLTTCDGDCAGTFLLSEMHTTETGHFCDSCYKYGVEP